ncbi:hypothetical protein D5400_14190 [Georhizobium profundi]|uniref:DNA repair protein MmcB-related protein n=1 Tax=Georhizobium profundi TaxID=2341112 RepID=A0A3S9B5R5_9HYPH|nr:hypothetical protein [Georhizobium profundi]AZN72273.1 hypothetical protein D5400_14190 [Georhizobium profundi]
MAGSSAERELRDFVVSRLRELFPTARIVHELNVAGTGSNRIDVAAVTRQAIIGVEIKSEKDTLKRLDEQWDAFSKCCHFVFVAAHEKHFAEYREPWMSDGSPSEIDLNHPAFLGVYRRRRHCWRYPTPIPQYWSRAFDPFKDVRLQPRASALLGLLWREELCDEARRHSVSVGSRATRHSMICEMVWRMTGREIAEAVCRQLRQRSFAEADTPIADEGGA